ncbi:MAG: hypothetical protein KGO51_13535 [Alphaproteobacteria bacterium]|nr:hypothetical protein [Alphaproteobacteria bacterium]
MTPADERLRALLEMDEPPARDPAFSAAVMEQVMRRRWLQDLGFLAGLSLVGGAALWGLWPVLEPALIAISGRLAPAAAALAVGASALAALRALPGQGEVPA